jgi:hypothetical protein
MFWIISELGGAKCPMFPNVSANTAVAIFHGLLTLKTATAMSAGTLETLDIPGSSSHTINWRSINLRTTLDVQCTLLQPSL